ncbi:MAG TPA: outer membrane beta-barrel protein [Vicinamibacterales bacterium]|nr:outer membrane beta-barrel protein [Vicinamibacterales bacterium]
MTRIALAIAIAVFVGASSTAHAQSAAVERGYITGAADLLVAGSTFTDTIHPIEFAEAATITTSYPSKTTIGFAVGGGARVWRRLSLGLEVGRVSRSADADISAQVPHPFLFNTPRSVSGSASGIDRAELAVHIIAAWVAPLSDRWQLSVGGGPSWISVDQSVVSDITVSQTYPYDTATFASATTQQVSKGRAGFNVGAEAAYLFRPHAGLAVGARYAHAHVPLTSTASTDAGGAHVTAGLRLRF